MKWKIKMDHSATYSPEDNKIRITPAYRLDAGEYAKVKAAGFAWATKQQIFIAPMWTPQREDIAMELCGEINDEDSSLVDRAEDRAERFEGYQANRRHDAEQALNAADRLAERFYMGQPILVGHHSERKARKDAARVDSLTRRAVRAFETSEYWERRAAAAIRHAKYKERPDVRHRRIKGLEADERKFSKQIKEYRENIKFWCWPVQISAERAEWLANYHHGYRDFETPAGIKNLSMWSALKAGLLTPEEARIWAYRVAITNIGWSERWLTHTRNRLTYERAMLGESGGIVAERFGIQVGGKVYARGEWVDVLKLNKKGGALVSVTTNARYCRIKSVEEIKDYQPPTEEAAAKAAKGCPILNYSGTVTTRNRYTGEVMTFEAVPMTKAEYAKIHADYKGTHTSADGSHRVRSALIRGSLCIVYLSDQKEKRPEVAA